MEFFDDAPQHVGILYLSIQIPCRHHAPAAQLCMINDYYSAVSFYTTVCQIGLVELLSCQGLNWVSPNFLKVHSAHFMRL